MPSRLSPAQIRGARGMLGWSMLDLAKASNMSVSTVKRMEMAEPQPVSNGSHETVRAALERAGMRFIEGMGREGEIGMRLLPSAPASRP